MHYLNNKKWFYLQLNLITELNYFSQNYEKFISLQQSKILIHKYIVCVLYNKLNEQVLLKK
jgi:hypothetical protein